jgi:mannose-6-phosphate isomerase-like protein (cupin superfamily)
MTAVAVVAELDDADALEVGGGAATLRRTLDAASGCPRLVQQVLSIASGGQLDGVAAGAGELWYVRAGSGSLLGAGCEILLRPGCGALVPAGPYTFIAAPADDGVELVTVVLPTDTDGVPPAALVSRPDECEVELTGDRRFRVLVGPAQGCAAATQFVGEIPPGRAAVHEHTYDEVVFVLSGQGVVHLAENEQPLKPGTCVYLPPGSPHCLENTGSETLYVLGVFHPGGSPAAKKEHPD